ncbi:hypothetical protein [Poseidonocella sp. HB161398]|uniref:hypothetical protein n=1 Tax=Poseidonocella sp. HB161398 TaxID=2320855 RepID=UPI001107D74D|nr:hypothetical protein [Poseidonocella sp. HB161398]
MTRTLLLHAGMPKTGTTSIQNACHAVRGELLAMDRLLYLGVAANHTNPMCTLFMDDPSRHIANRMAGIRSKADVEALQKKYRDNILRELEQDNWDRVMVSAEGLSNLSREELESLRVWFSDYVDEIDVLYYIREPVAYTTSVAQQLLKGGDTLAQLYKKIQLPNFIGRIGNAIATFGVPNVRVRDFGAAVKVEGGLVADFCLQMDMSEEAAATILAASSFDNEALSMEGAEMLSSLNSLRPLFDETGRRPNRTGKETLAFEQLGGNKFLLPLEVRREIHAGTREDVDWINRTFGLDLFQTPEPAEKDGELSKDKQRDAADTTILLISDLLNTIEALKFCLMARDFESMGKLEQMKRQLEHAKLKAPDDRRVLTEVERFERMFRDKVA